MTQTSAFLCRVLLLAAATQGNAAGTLPYAAVEHKSRIDVNFWIHQQTRVVGGLSTINQVSLFYCAIYLP